MVFNRLFDFVPHTAAGSREYVNYITQLCSIISVKIYLWKKQPRSIVYANGDALWWKYNLIFNSIFALQMRRETLHCRGTHQQPTEAPSRGPQSWTWKEEAGGCQLENVLLTGAKASWLGEQKKRTGQRFLSLACERPAYIQPRGRSRIAGNTNSYIERNVYICVSPISLHV